MVEGVPIVCMVLGSMLRTEETSRRVNENPN